ncbi:MAG: anthranilate phosphoribosyltransferase [Verrucomicrobiota bacterium]
MKTLIEKLGAGGDLTDGDIRYVVPLLLSDAVEDELKAEFLTALHKKGETAEEVASFVELFMARADDPKIDPNELSGPMIDVAGTGGDGLDFFNVSTTIMFILAAAGAVVVKHGNRGVTSSCGSADVLEELGVPIHLGPEDLKECAQRIGVAFIFARQYHPAFREIAKMRERLARQKSRSIFSLLGPLLNPAHPPRQLIGVFAPHLTTLFAEVLRKLGRKKAWVVHGLAENTNGLDDISICGATMVAELQDDKITSAILDTQWLGVGRCPVEELLCGSPPQNAAALEGILSGEIQGAKREMAVVNAGGGFVVAGLAREMNAGIALAREQIDNGRALEKLRALQNYKPNASA